MLLARLNFSQYRSNSKVKVTGFKMLVLTERSSPKEYLCEISKLWHSLFEVISKVQVSGSQTYLLVYIIMQARLLPHVWK